MSFYDYQTKEKILRLDPPFASLIMAALQRADTPNAYMLRAMWPEICDEAQARYDAPGGLLEGESDGS